MSLSQEIESKINIVDLVGRYVPLKKSGANYKALSPFVQEKTPSFMVSPAKNIAYCFSSRRGGGPIKFLMEVEKISYHEALERLAKEAGVELAARSGRGGSGAELDIYDCYDIAAKHFQGLLFSDAWKKALAYLHSRGLSDETIKKFGLGYAEDDGRPLFRLLKERGAKEAELLENGLFVSPTRGKFSGRVVFPIRNFAGSTVAFTGRTLLPDGMPKYLNSPTTRIFNKSEILYGLSEAKSDIMKADCILVVEGQMDTVSLHQAGVGFAVGISGIALTRDHIRFVKRLTKRVVLCLDGDSAGTNATFSSIENLIGEDVDVRVLRLPYGKDPDEFVRSGGDFSAVLDDALDTIGFLVAEGHTKYDTNSITGKTALTRELVRYAKRMTSRVETDLTLRRISEAMNVSYDAIVAEYRGQREDAPSPSYDTPKAPTEKTGFSLSEIIAGQMSTWGLWDLFFAEFAYTLDDLPEEGSFLMLKRVAMAGADYVTDDRIDQDTLSAIQLLVEEESTSAGTSTLHERFRSLVHRLGKFVFDQKKSQLMQAIGTAASPEDRATATQAYQNLLSHAKTHGFV